MNTPQVIHAGIDVAAKTLAIAIRRPGIRDVEQLSISNDPKGHQKLIGVLTRDDAHARVCLEWTGTYSLDLAIALVKAGSIEVCCVNPYAARKFAEFRLVRAKTDHVDATVLLDMLAHGDLVLWTPPSRELLHLRAICRSIQAMTASCTAAKNRLHATEATDTTPACVTKAHMTLIATYEKEIAKLEAEALELVAAESTLTRSLTVLTSVKGIGVRTALVLIAEFAVLPDDLEPGQVAAYAGLDPRTKESGTSVRGSGSISRRGNANLRAALYMPSLCSVRYEPAVRDAYQRLLARGKKKQVAQVAIMRRLLITLWTMMRTATEFQPEKFRPRQLAAA